ncbi:hypothetical protein EQ500_04260 [Lactobacillus sp. XV13L]|nr:hypothetical protein [Lactobacillus sp. XV13L]
MNKGTIQAAGDLDTIINKYAHPVIELYFSKKVPLIPNWTMENDHLKSAKLTSNEEKIALLQQVFANPQVRDAQISQIKIVKADLESAYHTMIKYEGITNAN